MTSSKLTGFFFSFEFRVARTIPFVIQNFFPNCYHILSPFWHFARVWYRCSAQPRRSHAGARRKIENGLRPAHIAHIWLAHISVQLTRMWFERSKTRLLMNFNFFWNEVFLLHVRRNHLKPEEERATSIGLWRARDFEGYSRMDARDELFAPARGHTFYWMCEQDATEWLSWRIVTSGLRRMGSMWRFIVELSFSSTSSSFREASRRIEPFPFS